MATLWLFNGCLTLNWRYQEWSGERMRECNTIILCPSKSSMDASSSSTTTTPKTGHRYYNAIINPLTPSDFEFNVQLRRNGTKLIDKWWCSVGEEDFI